VATISHSQGPLVGLPLRGVRVFEQFAWLGVGSGKMALFRPAHQHSAGATRRVTPGRWAARQREVTIPSPTVQL